MLLNFYILRNYAESASGIAESKDQKFNNFLREARQYMEKQGY